MDSNPSSPVDETTIRRRRSDGVAPPTAKDYLNPDYWNQRFSEEEHYEWFKGYSHFRDLLLKHLLPNHSVLEIGCGNSQLCEELYRDGFKNLTCIDLSAVAVDRMQKKLSAIGVDGIKVLEADMLDLPFANESFNVVIEKGTMDVLFVDSGDPWNPRPSTVDKVMAMLEGVHKVLKPDGMFISISFGQPHFRRRLFESPGFTWSVNWNTFGDGFHYFFYTLKKGERPSDYKASGQISDMHSLSLFHEELEDEDYIFRTAVEELNT
ncbi:hypothetical protein QJS10_CPB17g02582 [Acorus calamus]|uniref:EEF1A lysine methyltransferase 4 n=1 Tax=Acorus calamus TaxID=4465 RepID=A0AAV9CS28_ACOCL|nr:hypothetical protein QJS10_CPB17g02582 [Acorus calamus]